jgi:NADH-quinone oxidoreductase subunit B
MADGIEGKLPEGVLLTSVSKLVQTLRAGSQWPVTMGLACCSIEMMAAGTSRFDISRFGMEVFRASPRQADLMLVNGRMSHKMATVVRQVYDQMADPKWCISMGSCASSGGIFNNYAIVQGVDHVVPVDVYIPGCPPRPEMLIHAILELQDQIKKSPLGADRIKVAREVEKAALNAVPVSEMRGLLA